jgi:hypothetical protein
MSAPQPWPERRKNRVTVHASCDTCGGARGFTNLLVTKLPDGRIQFDPHATGVCTVTVEEDAARMVMDALARWLG